MADKKISALTGATTPLAGSEVLPIVQGGTTVKVSVANLTAGRSPSVASLVSDDGTNGRWTVIQEAGGNRLYSTTPSFGGWRTGAVQANGTAPNMIWRSDGNTTVGVGNLVVGTAGKGIDFSANAHAAGMTSELLNDYEEGTWTPTVTPFSGTITSYTSSGTYTKIGNRVFFSLQVALTDNGTGAGVIDISLPYTVGAVSAGSGQNINSLWGLNGSIGAGGTIMCVARADGSYPGATGQTLRMFGAFIV